MNPIMFNEITHFFTNLPDHGNTRVIILTANGKAFSAGLDLMEAANMFKLDK